MAALDGAAPVKNRRWRLRSDRPTRKSLIASRSPLRARRIAALPVLTPAVLTLRAPALAAPRLAALAAARPAPAVTLTAPTLAALAAAWLAPAPAITLAAGPALAGLAAAGAIWVRFTDPASAAIAESVN